MLWYFRLWWPCYVWIVSGHRPWPLFVGLDMYGGNQVILFLAAFTAAIPSESETVWIWMFGDSHNRLFVPSITPNLADLIYWSRSSRVSHSSIRLKPFLSSISWKTRWLRQPLSFPVDSIIERSVCMTSFRFSGRACMAILTMITEAPFPLFQYSIIPIGAKHLTWCKSTVFLPSAVSKQF